MRGAPRAERLPRGHNEEVDCISCAEVSAGSKQQTRKLSKLIYICFRHESDLSRDVIARNLSVLLADICPDNLSCPDPFVSLKDKIALAISNPSAAIDSRDTSICVGAVNRSDWDKIGSPPPDGNYLIIRADKYHVDVVADAVASRAAWYFISEQVFIVATSQRAIVRAIGAFEFNRSVIPWMLTTGTLGPKGTWDRRLTRIGPSEVVVLDRKKWRLRIDILPDRAPAAATPDDLRGAVEQACTDVSLDPDSWALPLSGGYDSRALLVLMAKPNGLRTVTWGRSGSRDTPGTDAYIAKKLARHLGVTNEYFETDVSDEPIDRIFERFIVAGEGGCDHVSAYMDGFEVWRTLFTRGITGILRGDEAFGWKSVVDESDVRDKVGIPLWEDYKNLPPAEELGIEAPKIPEELRRRHEESLPDWRDRLYRNFRIPILLSALSDLKLPYIEISNPLLSRSIVAVSSALPDSWRTEKLAFRKFVEEISPKVPFARRVSIKGRAEIVRDQEFVTLLRSGVRSTTASSLFSSELRQLVEAMISTRANRVDMSSFLITRKIRSTIASGISKALRLRRSRSADYYVIALRMAIIIQMHDLLSSDGSTAPILQSMTGE